MALLAGHLSITLRGLVNANQWNVRQWYRTDGAAFLTADPVGVGEAWWNDVKTAIRAMMVAGGSVSFTSAYVSEPGVNGAYGEFAIPVGEQVGTRSGSGVGDSLPPFTAMGARLTVATRTTRPGQKRFPGLYEIDSVAGLLQPTLAALLATAMAKFSDPITLGAPVATGVLHPEIVRISEATGEVVASQDVTGFVINPFVTTQNSRKYGRGV